MVSVTLLGIAQDGGVPQAGCSCPRCMAVHEGRAPELYPVALGITDDEGKHHLIEASRTLSRQLYLWGKSIPKAMGHNNDGEDESRCIIIPSVSSVTLTHLHLGHVDGIPLFGREAIGASNNSIRLISSKPVIDALDKRSSLDPFHTDIISDGSIVQLGKGVELEFSRVPHREEEGSEMYGIIIRGKEKSIFFLPDHDTYEESLEYRKMNSVKEWLQSLKVDVVLIDGTFFTIEEICARRSDAKGIPHPPISESLRLLGKRDEGIDPKIFFIHLNHTNSVIDNVDRRLEIEKLGWSIGSQGQIWLL